MSQQTAGSRGSGRDRMKLKWVVVAVAVAAVTLLVVLLCVFLGRDRGTELQGPHAAPTPETFSGISYDFSELPAERGPRDVTDASYVSILLASDDRKLILANDDQKWASIGLNSNVPAAQALSQAVERAEEVDAAIVFPSTTSSDASGETGTTLASTLTFLLPDRSTLTFDLFVEQGLVARGGRAWRVDGDLAALIEAAVEAGR